METPWWEMKIIKKKITVRFLLPASIIGYNDS
jgi:hypothetical protein